ncbi:hypothetical protein V1507DRAFT_463371, partial [Lipomyces tetrasporus]
LVITSRLVLNGKRRSSTLLRPQETTVSLAVEKNKRQKVIYRFVISNLYGAQRSVSSCIASLPVLGTQLS